MIKNSHSEIVYSPISVESLISACLNTLDFAEITYFLFAPLCDFNNAAPIPRRRTWHKMVDLDRGPCLILVL